MLEQAAASGRRRLLHIAVNRALKSEAFASQAGDAGHAQLRDAKAKHEGLQLQFQATRGLDDAITAADSHRLGQAIQEADRLGLSGSKEATSARALLSKIQAGEFVPAKSSPTTGGTAWRQRHRMTRLPCLRDRSVPLYCSANPLTAPLLESSDGDEGAYSAQAVKMSADIVDCMWPNSAEGLSRCGIVAQKSAPPCVQLPPPRRCSFLRCNW